MSVNSVTPDPELVLNVKLNKLFSELLSQRRETLPLERQSEIMFSTVFQKRKPLVIFDVYSTQSLQTRLLKGRGDGGEMAWCWERLIVQRGLKDNSLG